MTKDIRVDLTGTCKVHLIVNARMRVRVHVRVDVKL